MAVPVLVANTQPPLEEKNQRNWQSYRSKVGGGHGCRCGLLSHGLEECKEGKGEGDHVDFSKLQYGAWLRGEAPRRSSGEFIKDRQEDGRFDWGWSENKAKGSQAREKYATEAKIATRKVPESTHPSAGTGVTGNGTNNEDQSCQVPVSDHEKGKGNGLGEKTNGILPNSCKEDFEGSEARKASIDGVQCETGTSQGEDNLFEFRVTPTNEGIIGIEARQEMECGPGPMALCYKENAGWVAEHLGPTSGQ